LLYRLLFKLVLVRIDAERAHALGARVLRWLGRAPVLAALVRRYAHRFDDVLRVQALGLSFPSPLGVAAGLDKEATSFEGLGALGFGFVEVGTITARAQEGNPRPRVWRVPRDRALINAMGFPNPGAEAAAARLRGGRRTVIGVNIGRSKLADDALADYRTSTRRLAPLADYLVLNVSSPNTPGLRDLQAVEALRELVGAVREELAALGGRRVPLLVKLAPDLADSEIDAIADLALELRLDGIVAVNTTVERRGLTAAEPGDAAGRGGVSGAPLKARALEVLRRLHARAGDRLVLVSTGGIESADDAWERLQAGATLVQAYTGFVYGGPLWPARVNRELARRLRRAVRRS
jgi:dihydroorotate dehydrogenase